MNGEIQKCPERCQKEIPENRSGKKEGQTSEKSKQIISPWYSPGVCLQLLQWFETEDRIIAVGNLASPAGKSRG
jgi:hypothetical protein